MAQPGHGAYFSMDDSVHELAKVYLEALSIPARSGLDALHLACAVSHETDYLLTWNCKHLAHGEIRRALQRINLQKGLFIPAIVTPEELLERSE